MKPLMTFLITVFTILALSSPVLGADRRAEELVAAVAGLEEELDLVLGSLGSNELNHGLGGVLEVAAGKTVDLFQVDLRDSGEQPFVGLEERYLVQIGDDAIQQRTQGRVLPHAFTHGTSEQRMRWFRRGLDSGLFEEGDTFEPAYETL